MPCYDANPDIMSEEDMKIFHKIQKEKELRGETNFAKYVRDNEDNFLKARNQFLEAAMCALLNELKQLKNYDEIITKASINGQVDLFDWLQTHTLSDIERLSKDLTKYSKHELNVLKTLL